MPEIWLDVDVAGVVPVNVMSLIDDTDFKSREVSVAYDASGMDLRWNFITSAGVQTSTAVTPTSASNHDWVHVGDGIYTLEIPTSGGDVNNDAEGYGWVTGLADGVLPWRGPVVGFRDAVINNLVVDNAASLTRGFSGTALPNAAADAAGGLVISDAGGLDIDILYSGIIIANGAVETDGSNSSTQVQTTLGEATNDHYNAGVILFTSGAEAGQWRPILDYVGASGTISWDTPLTDTPADDVTFVLLPSGTTALAVWDRILNGALHNIATSAGRRLRGVQEFQGYEEGAVWIDTENGTAGTISYENGTVELPVDSLEDAIVIASNVGLTRFHVVVGSTITFAEAHTAEVWVGDNWTLALENQDISNIFVKGARVSGIGTNTTGEQFFTDCEMGDVTIPDETHLINYGHEGTITLGEAGNFFGISGHMAADGGDVPVIDYGAALNASIFHLHGYKGLIEIENMGAGTGSYLLNLDGHGRIIYNANCSATSTVNAAGHWDMTNNATGITINENGNFERDELIDDIWDEDVTTHTDADSTGQAIIDILADTNELQGDDVPGLIAALNDLSAAEVASEIADALRTDTLTATPQGAPPTTPTIMEAVMTIYDALVHKISITNTLKEFHNNAGTVIWKKALSDDATTYIEAESASGP